MKSFLKVLAIILAIVAIIALLSLAAAYINGSAETFAKFLVEKSFFFQLSWGTVLLLAVAGLVLAAVLSPSGMSKVFDRIAKATSTVAGGVAKVASKTASSLIGGVVTGLFSGSWLGAIAIGAAIYLLWPDKEEQRAKRDAELASDLRIKEAREMRKIESDISSAQTGKDKENLNVASQ